MIWDKMDQLSSGIIEKFSSYNKEELPAEYELSEQGFTWKNYIWESPKFRRAHIEIVDARETKKMWIMHMCIFPHYNSPDPIFGFDIVAGQSKITGAFHDFSKIGNSELYDWYQNKMIGLAWSKPRELPEWARNIFSPAMLAAGNIQSEDEVNQLINAGLDNLDYYLYNVGKVNDEKADFKYMHNFYCSNQKKNIHTPAMMINFGIDKNTFMKFMDDVLFQEHNG
jgi:hypothetical protein